MRGMGGGTWETTSTVVLWPSHAHSYAVHVHTHGNTRVLLRHPSSKCTRSGALTHRMPPQPTSSHARGCSDFPDDKMSEAWTLSSYPGLQSTISLPHSCPSYLHGPSLQGTASPPSLSSGLSTYQIFGTVKSLELESYLFNNIYWAPTGCQDLGKLPRKWWLSHIWISLRAFWVRLLRRHIPKTRGSLISSQWQWLCQKVLPSLSGSKVSEPLWIPTPSFRLFCPQWHNSDYDESHTTGWTP